jgi:L-ascorbate metabolism protein UlaG (beta-lactamase superfamily)
MSVPQLKITYVGGPTALLNLGGLRLLTDPTFDPAQEYHPGRYVLRKTAGPAVSPESLGTVDVVLLSHDHHLDNLDPAGRAFLKNAASVLTTADGAGRLGNNAIGLVPWQSLEFPTSQGRVLRVTATPARHGPADMDRGPVTGFVLSFVGAPEKSIYVSGDTVWYEGVAEVGRRFSITTALLFMGAACVPEVGPWNLTFTAEEGVEFARAFPNTTIVPLHFEGWKHFSESRDDIARAFAAAGLEERLRWLEAGREIVVEGRDYSGLRQAV